MELLTIPTSWGYSVGSYRHVLEDSQVASGFVLTSDLLRATYNMVAEMPPFVGWNLPDGDDVEFQIVKDKGTRGWHRYSATKHSIGISRVCVQRYDTLILTMMHEMVHAHEGNIKLDRKDVDHSSAFNRWAAQVCRIHKLDPGIF
jgi:SprT-like family protein